MDTQQHQQGGGIDVHGIQGQNPIGRAGPANQSPEVEHKGYGNTAKGKDDRNLQHAKISLSDAS